MRMPTKEEFNKLIVEAYHHLYDLVYLRTHPLADLLIQEAVLHRGEKAQRLHHLLLNAVEELYPGSQAPVFSKEWRRYRLMVLHMVDGLEPPEVAAQLNISRRQFYREQIGAIDAIADILWERYKTNLVGPGQAFLPEQESASSDRIELLRLEAARLSQTKRYTSLEEVVRGVILLLQEPLNRQKITLELQLPETLSEVTIDHHLIRQLVLVVLGYMIKFAEQARLQISAVDEDAEVILKITIEPPGSISVVNEGEIQEQLSMISEMAELSAVEITPILKGNITNGFYVHLPTSLPRTVMVVDDNEDILELFRRYLTMHHYRVVPVGNSSKAISLARQIQPYAITLDLMMPGQDGWDVLQHLLNQPDTRHIPIIVCSVIKQKDLALMLGATAFLEKPVSEQALLAVLDSLEITEPSKKVNRAAS
jgi:CheY-like chemotaxis protein